MTDAIISQNRRLIRCMNHDVKAILNRTTRLLGDATMERIADTRVIIFGVGGVGSWCAESLVRSGICHLTIVDSDCVSVSNINRQAMASVSTVGRVKVEAMRERLLDINPSAEITAIQDIFCAETADSFELQNYDYIIDAIDSLKNKLELIVRCAQKGMPTFFSSMGAALKMDPTMVRVSEFWEVDGCPLAAVLRRRMRKFKRFPGRKFKCVWSPEVLPNLGEVGDEGNSDNSLSLQDWNATKAQINGTTSHVTAIFGFTLAGLVIQDLYRQ